MVHKHSTEMSSSISKCEKVEICILEKICVLGKPSSGMSYIAVGWEFNVNELTKYIE